MAASIPNYIQLKNSVFQKHGLLKSHIMTDRQMLNGEMHQYLNNTHKKKKKEIENQIRLALYLHSLIELLNCHDYSYYFREQE